MTSTHNRDKHYISPYLAPSAIAGVANPASETYWRARPVEDSYIDLEDNAVKRIAAATLLKAIEDYQAICRGKTIPDTELCELVQFLVSPYAAALFCAAGIGRDAALLQLAETQIPPNAILMAAISRPARAHPRPIASHGALNPVPA